MWNPESLWLEVAIVMSLFAIGSILFGHFEEHKSKGRRLLKVAIVLVLVVGVSTMLGRTVALLLVAFPIIGAAVVHLWWLPKNGINGWTGEPREKYYALVGYSGKCPYCRTG